MSRRGLLQHGGIPSPLQVCRGLTLLVALVDSLPAVGLPGGNSGRQTAFPVRHFRQCLGAEGESIHQIRDAQGALEGIPDLILVIFASGSAAY